MYSKPDHDHQATNICHCITGGVGGMGILMANILVQNGVKSTVLTSRRDTVPPESQEMYDKIANSRAQIVRRRLNSASALGTREIIQENTVHPPITGITHGAGVLRDGMINQQTRGKWKDTLQPKYYGAWILNNLMSNKPWETSHFLVFSSMAAIGSAGQSNHSGSCSGLDLLCHYRMKSGMVGTAVNLGAIAEVGYAARHSVGAGGAGPQGAKSGTAEKKAALEATITQPQPTAGPGAPNQEGEKEETKEAS